MAFFRKLLSAVKGVFWGRRKKRKPSRKKLKPRKPQNNKPTSQRSSPKPKITPVIAKEVFIGHITHYFSRIKVGVVKILQGDLEEGEMIHVKGAKTDFRQKVKSMQVESVNVKKARKGQLIGLKVIEKANVGDKVYKVKS